MVVDRVDPQPEREVPRTVEQAPCDVVLEATARLETVFQPTCVLAWLCPSVSLQSRRSPIVSALPLVLAAQTRRAGRRRVSRPIDGVNEVLSKVLREVFQTGTSAM